MIQSLSLQKCADSMIGSVLIRGISGGEKRRTAIGCELVTKPKTLFLDEPTSGLDSYAAYNVSTILNKIAHSGTTVLCTIHQPSSEVFHSFTHTLILANGRLMYRGEVAKLGQYFGDQGFPCPSMHNPADHVMYLVQTQELPVLERLAEACEAVELREFNATIGNNPTAVADSKNIRFSRLTTSRAGFFTQLSALFMREARNLIRDKQTLIARYVMTILLNLIFSLIFYRIGSRTDIAGLQRFEFLIFYPSPPHTTHDWLCLIDCCLFSE
eukprot:c9939_g1_i2.p1 GENE.c9939_g1_i2~~c9939_g1_i2.p1  ORF type:complete len:270 (+),score=59.57 c9939_g1_i2:139-948(+)